MPTICKGGKKLAATLNKIFFAVYLIYLIVTQKGQSLVQIIELLKSIDQNVR
jgi:intergrase/recombinase